MSFDCDEGLVYATHVKYFEDILMLPFDLHFTTYWVFSTIFNNFFITYVSLIQSLYLF